MGHAPRQRGRGRAVLGRSAQARSDARRRVLLLARSVRKKGRRLESRPHARRRGDDAREREWRRDVPPRASGDDRVARNGKSHSRAQRVRAARRRAPGASAASRVRSANRRDALRHERTEARGVFAAKRRRARVRAERRAHAARDGSRGRSTAARSRRSKSGLIPASGDPYGTARGAAGTSASIRSGRRGKSPSSARSRRNKKPRSASTNTSRRSSNSPRSSPTTPRRWSST